eukprot:TRINITY_DN6623_c0_g1_i3.p1 TRINITY_DN6623_c0_g1~~TRINITY_DN6623_c0_g1_i3.p1  ORF type:complete len:236 (+),score=47.97 TRINITY_DN6623_c0_g1_i3:113-820(+)
MSRAHMIYNDVALEGTDTRHVKWKTEFDYQREFCKSGNGYLVSGRLEAKPNRLIITDVKGQQTRLLVLQLQFEDAFQRQFNQSGVEVDVVQASSTKVRTGYLNSSYRTDEARSDRVSADQVEHSIYTNVTELVPTTRVQLRGNDLFTFIGLESVLQQLELIPGENYRLRTIKDSCFIESLASTAGSVKTVTNFTTAAGVDVRQEGASWTDKITTKSSEAAPGDELEGVDEDEWDD